MWRVWGVWRLRGEDGLRLGRSGCEVMGKGKEWKARDGGEESMNYEFSVLG